MKKFFCILLLVAMVLTSLSSAFAATGTAVYDAETGILSWTLDDVNGLAEIYLNGDVGKGVGSGTAATSGSTDKYTVSEATSWSTAISAATMKS